MGEVPFTSNVMPIEAHAVGVALDKVYHKRAIQYNKGNSCMTYTYKSKVRSIVILEENFLSSNAIYKYSRIYLEKFMKTEEKLDEI